MEDQIAERQISDAKPLRLWPAFLVLGVQAVALVLTVTPQINNLTRFGYMMLGPAVCILLFAIWLFFASRLRWPEAVMIAAGMLAMGVVTGMIVDRSMRTALWIYGVPLAMLLVVVALRLSRSWRPAARAKLVMAITACGWSVFVLGRLEGFDGSYFPEFQWRWQASHEEMLVASERVAPRVGTATTLALAEHDWPGFRGVHRNSRVRTARIITDWDSAPPQERWRIDVGPAWSSFAHVGGRLFTQEQRGDSEIVVCYDAETGSEIWRRATPARFSEVVSGAGPRATPTYAAGRLYTMGAKGVLSCLDAATGDLVWQRKLMPEIGAQLPMWGFSGSPLVTHNRVIVYADGKDDRGLVAYDASTGEPAWHVGTSGMNYGSAQFETIAGAEIALFTGKAGLLGIAPATGEVLWQFKPSGWKAPPMVQPQMIGPQSVIVPLGDGIGVARLEIERQADDWKVTERWTSRYLKPSFNDFVFHDGYLYGFDQSIFTCVDAQTGRRKWKRGRYGFGQVLMLEMSSSLLVTSEAGELVLLAADPNEHRELGRFPAVRGKTWNHAIMVDDQLFVRNGQEAVCIQLPSKPTVGG